MHPLRKEARESEISHLDSSETKRGEYRITNPYELTSNSLDDLFGSHEKSDDVSIDVGEGLKSSTATIAPTKQQENEEYDLQAELERKFDELFGPPNKK